MKVLNSSLKKKMNTNLQFVFKDLKAKKRKRLPGNAPKRQGCNHRF